MKQHDYGSDTWKGQVHFVLTELDDVREFIAAAGSVLLRSDVSDAHKQAHLAQSLGPMLLDAARAIERREDELAELTDCYAEPGKAKRPKAA